MKKRIVCTFDVVTPESAEEGDIAESGFCDGSGKGERVGSAKQAIDFLKRKGVYEGNLTSYYTVDSEKNYSDGSETTYGYHLKGFTKKEIERISRTMGNRLTGAQIRRVVRRTVGERKSSSKAHCREV